MKGDTTTDYKDALVTYIDVLGFRELIKRRDANHLLRILTRARTHLSKDYRYKNQYGEPAGNLKSLVFSDLVVRCRIPKGTPDIGDILGREVFTLAKHQAFLASKGVFLRGAICWGKIYIKQGLIFGPGLVRSFDLERALAIFPRIVIDAQLAQRIRGNRTTLPPDDCITKRDDGVLFVDYLYGNFVNQSALDVGERPWTLLQNHKHSIERAIAGKDARKDERVRQKYLWLGHYHNWTLRRLHNLLGDSSPDDAKHLGVYSLDEGVLRY